MARPFILTGLLLSVAAVGVAAEKPNPTLTASIDGVNDASMKSNALTMSKLDMAITVRGGVAETTITAQFKNPTSRALEGNFSLDMPLGSVVSGYALDVNGVMVDGVLVPPHQAQVAYEQRVTRRVDPGIVEVTRGSQFSTRVFPILPGSGRTIRLRYVTPLDVANGYQLPLTTPGKVGKFTLSITASGLAEAPRLTLPEAINATWSRETPGSLSFSAADISIKGNLSITLPAPAAAITLSQQRGEGRYFEIRDSAPLTRGAAAQPRMITIMWDRSVSRLDDKIDDEIKLVSLYLERVKPESLTLILFDSGAAETLTFTDRAELITALRSVRYRGATSFARLASASATSADTCLLFSDGVSTLDKPGAFTPACTLFAITSTRDADRGFLESRARRTGGDLLNLAASTTDDVMTRLTRRVPRVIDVRSSAGDAIDYALLDGGAAGWRIIGEAPQSGDVIVKVSGIGAGLTERRYPVGSFAAPDFDGPGALWASSRIASAAADADPAETLALARRFSVASPLASFIVLETPEDYAQADIEPPMSYPKPDRARFDAMRAARTAERDQAVENRLRTVIAGWEAQKAWWNRKFDPNAAYGGRNDKDVPRPPVPTAGPGVTRPEPEQRPQSAPPSLPPPPPSSLPAILAPPPAAEAEEDGIAEIVVTSSRADGRTGAARARTNEDMAAADAAASSDRARPSGAITLQPWSSDRPYIAEFDKAGANFDKVFLTQEQKHGSLPIFYLDTAEWLFAKGQKAEAARMVASALELPTRNNNTLAIVAARLLRYGEPDRSIALLEALVKLEPERPQPRRTLALALLNRARGATPAAAQAYQQRALDLLTEVIMTPWEDQYGGIEIIALMEANALIPRLRAAGNAKISLDAQLITLLDTDLRVTIEWNTKATDMDLWVDEPSRERVIYNNSLSARGGKLSRDMTQGFGPEEYLLRRASAGTYTVRANTFATDRLNPNGATTVTARLIRNFGRANEQEELIDIEVLPGRSGERLIGKIDVKP